MKQSKKFFWVLLFSLLAIVFLVSVGCPNPIIPEPNPFVGTWKGSPLGDLTYLFMREDFTWSIIGGITDYGTYTQKNNVATMKCNSGPTIECRISSSNSNSLEMIIVTTKFTFTRSGS